MKRRDGDGTDCRAETRVTARVGAEQDTAPGKAKLPQAPVLPSVPGVQRAPGSEEPRDLLSPEHRAMRKKSHCRQTSGI